MAWRKCENCNGKGSIFNYEISQPLTCERCLGAGQFWERSSSGTTLRESGNKNRDSVDVGNPQQNAKYILATVTFFGVGYYVLTQSPDNLVGAGILALISALIAYKWFKAIMIILVIVAVAYFIGMDK